MDIILDTIPKVIAWILFVNGCLALLGSGIVRLIKGKESEPAVFIVWGIAIVSLMLSVVVVYLINQ